jgi:hypothetical protein
LKTKFQPQELKSGSKVAARRKILFEAGNVKTANQIDNTRDLKWCTQ